MTMLSGSQPFAKSVNLLGLVSKYMQRQQIVHQISKHATWDRFQKVHYRYCRK